MTADLVNMDGVALDDVTVADARWFDAHPFTTEGRRHPYPVEIEAPGLSCQVLDHYRVSVRRIARESFAKAYLHRDHDGDGLRIVCLGAALYPTGALDVLVTA